MREKIKCFFVHKLNALYQDFAIIRAKQNFATKFKKYMVVDLMGEHSVGDQYYGNKFGGIREATLNIQAFGENSIEALSYLWMLLQRDTDECFEENIAILKASDVQDLTSLLDNREWREHASIDLTISYAREIELNLPFFDSVEIIGRKGNQNIYEIDNRIILTNSQYKDIVMNGCPQNNIIEYENGKWVECDKEIIINTEYKNG